MRNGCLWRGRKKLPLSRQEKDLIIMFFAVLPQLVLVSAPLEGGTIISSSNGSSSSPSVSSALSTLSDTVLDCPLEIDPGLYRHFNLVLFLLHGEQGATAAAARQQACFDIVGCTYIVFIRFIFEKNMGLLSARCLPFLFFHSAHSVNPC